MRLKCVSMSEAMRVGAFHVAAELDVLPAFAVAHGAVGDALEEMRAFLHCAEKTVRFQNPRFFGSTVGTRVHDFKIQAIELLPHFGAALFANVAEIFARGGDAGNDRRVNLLRLKTRVGRRARVGSTGFAAAAGVRKRFQQEAPAAGAGFGRLIEPELEFDVDEACGVLGAFEIAAHPVKAVGDARKHSGVALEGADEDNFAEGS